MRRFLWASILLLAFIAAMIIWGIIRGAGSQQLSANFVGIESQPEGFRRADGRYELKFPSDFGPHPEYQTEWWYYTGNLESTSGNRFGYQLTFFRRGLLPPKDWTARESGWGANQVYMAHFALTDVASGTHVAHERLARGAAGLAGAQAEPYMVWLENWKVEQVGPAQFRLEASRGELLLDLVLTDLKGPVLHGDQGYSRKGAEVGNASYYFSQTRLASSGIVQVGSVSYEVEGLSWMDHEFSTSALSSGQIGWDWFSIQLQEGTELMVFQIRREDGSIDPFSSGTFIGAEGDTRMIEANDFEILIGDTWQSPDSGAGYPSKWQILVPSLELDLEIQPFLADQEMNVSYAYWEGAVQVRGLREGQLVSGFGYVEMTGYAQSMEGEF